MRAIQLDRATVPFLASAAVLITAGGLVAAVNSAAPFAHGSWLAAYLVLVGGIAQVALAAGAAALRRRPVPARSARLELWLWLAGSLGVPAGVLLDAPALVAVASVPLLAALALFGLSVRAAPAPARPIAVLYLLLVGSLAVSVAVGMGLAGALP